MAQAPKPNLEFVERFQELYNKDPNSRVFAPLVEGYRKMGFLKQAYEIGQRGVQQHPNFAGGRVALARVLLDMEQTEAAIPHLELATETAPENLLAHSLLAESLLKLQRPKASLKAFKMLLFLNPTDERAQKQVKRLESLTADDFEEDVFKMAPLKSVLQRIADDSVGKSQAQRLTYSPEALDAVQKQRFLDRMLSLTDAFIVRNDVERAIQTVAETERVLGPHPEVNKRKRVLEARDPFSGPISPPLDLTGLHPQTTRNFEDHVVKIQEKVDKLEILLKRIDERRHWG